jgi:hypothetical protein
MSLRRRKQEPSAQIVAVLAEDARSGVGRDEHRGPTDAIAQNGQPFDDPFGTTTVRHPAPEPMDVSRGRRQQVFVNRVHGHPHAAKRADHTEPAVVEHVRIEFEHDRHVSRCRPT